MGQPELPQLAEEWRPKSQALLNPEVRLEAPGRMELFQALWRELGFSAPALSGQELNNAASHLEDTPERVLVLAPLLSLGRRQELAERSLKLFGVSMQISGESVGNKLLANPEIAASDGYTWSSLRCVSDGGLLSRSNFANYMITSGQAMAVGSTPWFFTAIDAWPVPTAGDQSTSLPYSGLLPDIVTSLIEPSVIPETLLILAALKELSGTPFPRDLTYSANELVVASTIEDPRRHKVAEVACVGFRSEKGDIDLRFTSPDKPVVPQAANALLAPGDHYL